MLRKTISLTLLLSLIPLIISSLALYIIPGGRESPLEDLLFWGIHKLTWRDVHIIGGFLFITVSLWHTLINKKLLFLYVAPKTLHLEKIIPVIIAILVTLLIYIATLKGACFTEAILTWPPRG